MLKAFIKTIIMIDTNVHEWKYSNHSIKIFILRLKKI